MPLIFAPSANQISSVTLSSPTGYYGSTATFIVSTQGYNNGDTIYYSTTGSGIVQSTGTVTVSNYLGDLGTTNIPITTIRTTSTTAVITATFYNGSTPVTLTSGINNASIPLATPDQFFTATVLLLSPAGPGPTALTDLSGTTSSIFVASSATIRSFIPFTTPGISSSMFFNGSTDYLSIPGNAAFGMGTGDYTLEMSMYLTAASGSNQMIIDFRNSIPATGQPVVYLNTSRQPIFYLEGSGNLITGASALTIGVWYHVALSKVTGTYTLYINGSSVGTSANSVSVPTSGIKIGTDYTIIASFFIGYISNLRITKGLGVYTGAFTTPSGPLQLTQSAGTNIAAITPGQTSLLLLQSPQSPNNASSLDSASTNTVITTGGTPAQGTFSPFWPYATLFNGTNAYQTFPANSIFNFGTGDFTVECWLYLISAPSGTPEIFNAGDFHLNFRSGTTIAITNNSTVLSNVSNSIATSTWYHVAAVRASGNMTIYLNGVGNTPAANSNNFNTPAGGQIATQAGGSGPFLNGYISNLRAIKGQALYTTNFRDRKSVV